MEYNRGPGAVGIKLVRNGLLNAYRTRLLVKHWQMFHLLRLSVYVMAISSSRIPRSIFSDVHQRLIFTEANWSKTRYSGLLETWNHPCVGWALEWSNTRPGCYFLLWNWLAFDLASFNFLFSVWYTESVHSFLFLFLTQLCNFIDGIHESINKIQILHSVDYQCSLVVI